MSLCVLERFQRDVWQRLLASSLLATVSIVLSRPRVNAAGVAITDTAIQQTLNGALTGLVKRSDKSGAAIEVQMPNFRTEDRNTGGLLGAVEVPILVRENPMLNMSTATGTLLSAETIVLNVLSELHGWQKVSKSTAAAREMTTDKNAIQPLATDDGFVTYQLVMMRMERLANRARCAAPAISFSAGSATLTCATSGATIRYTLNGEYPGANADAGGEEIPGVSTYTTPVAVASGETLRCVASKAGLGDSDVIEYTA